ncbi:hypothetical protein Ancab_032387 [Ancistrocladus abbreviatus]
MVHVYHLKEEKSKDDGREEGCLTEYLKVKDIFATVMSFQGSQSTELSHLSKKEFCIELFTMASAFEAYGAQQTKNNGEAAVTGRNSEKQCALSRAHTGDRDHLSLDVHFLNQ